VVLHVAAIAWHFVGKRENLVKPMLDGDKTVATPVAASRDDAASRTLAAVLFALCGVAVAWMARLG
jgi:hypothetical protein